MKDSLGGNCNTVMLCCISPSDRVLQETLNCLKHGSLARNIINQPVVNEVGILSYVLMERNKPTVICFNKKYTCMSVTAVLVCRYTLAK